MTQRASLHPAKDFDLFNSHPAIGCLILTLV